MERLPFRLPDFTRINWTTEEARAQWSPKIDSIRAFLTKAEIASVQQSIRKAAMVPVAAAQLPTLRAQLHNKGFQTEEIYRFGTRDGYSSEVDPRNQSNFVCMLGLSFDDAALQLKDAHNSNDTHTIGRLLGYPECCISFFNRYWNEKRFIDTTWPMAIESTSSIIKKTDDEIEIDCRPQNNMLLRWLGVRPVFHLPCSFNCEPTKLIADWLADVANRIGFVESSNLLNEILSWPMQWSVLHGIAEIETPYFRISTKSDASATKLTVRKIGALKVPTATSAVERFGTRFPFAARLDRKGRAVMPAPLPSLPPAPDNWQRRVGDSYYEDNGFATRYHMERAQRPIIASILARKPSSVLYWGCKNGALLTQLNDITPATRFVGVEADEGRLARARDLNPDENFRFIQGKAEDISKLDLPNSDVAVFMVGRLWEIERKHAVRLFKGLRSNAPYLLAYAYKGWGGPSAEDILGEFGAKYEIINSKGTVVLRIF